MITEEEMVTTVLHDSYIILQKTEKDFSNMCKLLIILALWKIVGGLR